MHPTSISIAKIRCHFIAPLWLRKIITSLRRSISAIHSPTDFSGRIDFVLKHNSVSYFHFRACDGTLDKSNAWAWRSILTKNSDYVMTHTDTLQLHWNKSVQLSPSDIVIHVDNARANGRTKSQVQISCILVMLNLRSNIWFRRFRIFKDFVLFYIMYIYLRKAIH